MQYPPKAFRSCRGILTLEKKYGRDRLVAAWHAQIRKLQLDTKPLREVLELEKTRISFPDEEGKVQSNVTFQIPLPQNIRGREYYRKRQTIKLIFMEVKNKTAPVTGQQDQNAISLDLMNRMKLHGMGQRLSGKVLPAPLAIHDCGHVPFNAPRANGTIALRLPLHGSPKCGIPLQGLY